MAENHFMTLEFAAGGAFVAMTVKAWPVAPLGGGAPRSTRVYQRFLR